MIMKKIIFVAICVISCATAFGQTLRKTFLSHNGIVTQYELDKWTEAITNAEPGDTVYFTSGAFSGPVTISKPITLIGAGVGLSDCFNTTAYGDCFPAVESTTLSGLVTLAIAESETSASCCFEGIKFSGSLYGCNLSKITIRRCHLSNLFSNSSDYVVKNLVLENCYVGVLYPSRLETPNIYNCYIRTLFPGNSGITYTNCSFVGANTSSAGNNCTYVNCCMNISPDYSNYVNCVYYGLDANSTYSSCWQANSPHNLTATQLQESGYIGIDGTIVGPLGGPAPFTMKPSLPYIENGTVNYDAENKKINVSMTVKRGE